MCVCVSKATCTEISLGVTRTGEVCDRRWPFFSFQSSTFTSVAFRIPQPTTLCGEFQYFLKCNYHGSPTTGRAQWISVFFSLQLLDSVSSQVSVIYRVRNVTHGLLQNHVFTAKGKITIDSLIILLASINYQRRSRYILLNITDLVPNKSLPAFVRDRYEHFDGYVRTGKKTYCSHTCRTKLAISHVGRWWWDGDGCFKSIVRKNIRLRSVWKLQLPSYQLTNNGSWIKIVRIFFSVLIKPSRMKRTILMAGKCHNIVIHSSCVHCSFSITTHNITITVLLFINLLCKITVKMRVNILSHLPPSLSIILLSIFQRIVVARVQ